MTTHRPNAAFMSFVVFIAMLIAGSPVRAEQQAPAATTLTAAQIEQLVAPIALYPDDLLSQVLMAATYPIEVVEAARWSRDNPNVTGKTLEDAMQKQAWDPSVKALTAVPQTLQMMNDQLKWTQDLGNAFLAQQSDVLDAVQRLRERADKAGNLRSTPQQTVRRVNRPGGVSAAGAPAAAYEIVPAVPDEYYVPVYDPTVVYGTWPYDDYYPFYWYPPGWGGGWYGFGAGFFAGAAIWGGINWWNRNVYVDHHRFNQFNRTNITDRNWSHNVDHRRGVGYNNPALTNRFGDQGRGKARDQARQKVGQVGKGGMAGAGKGGMAGAGKGGMAGAGKGGMAGAGKGGMAAGGMGKAGMGGGKATRTASGMAGGMGKAGMAGGMATRTASGMAGMAGGGMYSGGGSRGLSAGMGFSGGGARTVGRGGGGGISRGGGGGRGGGGRGGGGRRSDIELKEDVTLLGHLANGIGVYRFVYKGTDTAYVGVMAQEVQRVRPDAVMRGRDGYLRVFYEKLGVKFQTYDRWLASGARVP